MICNETSLEYHKQHYFEHATSNQPNFTFTPPNPCVLQWDSPTN